ncbi:hypothetical protein [Aequorivita viscosa]|uniref:Uncharacterized protein n=1 Tax=Aequorivita viscosa TaxID=797419 RepID=A0A1M6FFU8_9FLAO|nr:hypothetical protein [Aequorivita viscosa]SDW68310.1 hypothetical protein SAMN05216556_108138 [Aequorivita viscosa]SHI96529.1 hypothetical protein SAMN04487908_107135 [Aequorivita viscosa]
MINKAIQNTVIFTLIPLLGFLTFYLWVRFDYSLLTLNKMDFALLGIVLFAVTLYLDKIQIHKKVKYYNLLLQERELSSIDQFIHPNKREIIGNNKMYLDINSIDIFNQENQCVFHYNAKKNIIEIKKRFSSLKILTGDIEFLILEYDKTYRNTLKGWLTRGDLDKIQSISIISAKLISGKIIPIIEIIFDETIISNRLNNLSEPKKDEFNFFPVGLKTTRILSNKLKKEYLVINYQDEKPMHNTRL